MSRPLLPYQEGDWFAVPLPREDGYAIGRIVRARPRGKVLCGYFFGPRRHTVPPLIELTPLTPIDAILIALFGDLGLIDGTWPILGQVEPWERQAWPLPIFGRTDEDEHKAWKVKLADDDPSVVVSERSCSPQEARHLPKEGLMGAGAVERYLAHLLGKHTSG
jgi:hypothetical protein